MSEQTPQNETSKSVMEAFTFIKSADETLKIYSNEIKGHCVVVNVK